VTDRRVVITGLGVVCPAGTGIEAFWQSMLQNRSAIGPITKFDASNFPCRIAGQLSDDFSARSYVPKDYRKAVKVMARDIEIAVAAADMAFRDSGIVTRGIDPQNTTSPSKRLGCNIGAGLICTDLDELGTAVISSLKDGKFDFKTWGANGMQNLTPLWLLKYLPNMLSCHVTIIHGAEGPSNTITCGDASGILSASEATRQIQRGAADVIIAGGAESKLNPMGLLRQGKLGRLCNDRNDTPAAACKPFDRQHAGTIIGEGGGLVILEELQHALARGARIYAEVAGIGAGCDPGGIDVTAPNVGSMDLSVRCALRNAGIDGSSVDAIVAHGTAVPGEDRLEVAAWRAALDSQAAQPLAVSAGAASGSLFAGAGGVSLALGAMMVHQQIVPPTPGFAQCDTGCELNFAASARPAALNHVVCGAFAVGGQSAAMVLKKYETA
jgi:3-oxoacyl-[acyl-carrier-protein] synthase II